MRWLENLHDTTIRQFVGHRKQLVVELQAGKGDTMYILWDRDQFSVGSGIAYLEKLSDGREPADSLHPFRKLNSVI